MNTKLISFLLFARNKKKRNILPVIFLISISILSACGQPAPPAITSTAAVIPMRIPPTIGSSMIGEDNATLVYVPEGEFAMGSDDKSDEQPIHKVKLNAFWIDQTEVTNKQYTACILNGGCTPPSNTSSAMRSSYYGNSEFDEFPVIYVDWNNANAYCSWAGRELPSEAQWEKAARGTEAFTYPWGDDAPNDTLLNYNQNIGDTTEVSKYPNGKSIYGADDMAGNVWEWVNDWYQSDYYAKLGDSTSNPQGPASSGNRVLRGGSWDFSISSARSANRDWVYPTFTYNNVGFRCARSLP